MINYAKVMKWANSVPQYTPAALAQFARPDKADVFLIAVAMRGGDELITHEKDQPMAKVRIPIANACLPFNVKTVNIYDVLAKYALPTFLIHPQGPKLGRTPKPKPKSGRRTPNHPSPRVLRV